MMVTKRHIGATVDLRNRYTNEPGAHLIRFEKRGQFDLALIRTAGGTELWVDRAELYRRRPVRPCTGLAHVDAADRDVPIECVAVRTTSTAASEGTAVTGGRR